MATDTNQIDCQFSDDDHSEDPDLQHAAEFMVVDKHDRDFMSAACYACEAHVGKALSHAKHVVVPDGGAHEWTVTLC